MTQLVRVLSAVGAVTRIFSFLFVVPFLVALAYEPWDTPLLGFAVPRNALVFLASFGIAALFWVPENVLTRHINEAEMPDRAAYLTVGVGWLVLTFFGMWPFILSGTLTAPADAWFETMSGLTTTGSTVVAGSLEAVAPSVMVWRALLQYLGGMGIIVLGVAVLSRMTHGGASLLAAETPGPTVQRLAPKLAETARTLWRVYALFSAALLVLLLAILLWEGYALKTAILDAVIHTFTTLSTGGFSNHTASIAFYDNVLLEVVVTVFMLLAATSFTLHYRSIHGDWRRAWQDPELRFMIGIYALVAAATTGLVWQAGEAFGSALRGATFTMASLLSTTGYATVDFDTWPGATKVLILLVMFMGGSAGSTSGGLKVVRILLLFKLVRREVNQVLHPRAVLPIRLGRQVVPDKTLWKVVAFFFAFITAWAVGSFIITATDPNLSLDDGASAAASAIANIGPGFGIVGPSGGYWDLQASTKMILSSLMWLGRLEIFAVLLLFTRRTWR